jgi:hypothetical protein
MADSKVSVTFSSETSGCLIDLAKVTKKPVQELAEKLMQQAIDEIEQRWRILRLIKLELLISILKNVCKLNENIHHFHNL